MCQNSRYSVFNDLRSRETSSSVTKWLIFGKDGQKPTRSQLMIRRRARSISKILCWARLSPREETVLLKTRDTKIHKLRPEIYL
jgi:hypothetical protein